MFLRFSFTSHYPYLILLAINSVNISDSKLFCPLWCLVSQPSQSLSQLMNMLYVLSPVYLQRGVRERSLVGVWHPTMVNPLHQHWNIWGTNTGKSNCITLLLPHLKHTQYKSTEAKKNPNPNYPKLGHLIYHLLFHHCHTPTIPLSLLYTTGYMPQPKWLNRFVLLIFNFRSLVPNMLCI